MRSKIHKVILCGSGKGGTSKSTSATLIALELKKKGYNVALFDSDVSGPSLPKITGTNASLCGGPREGILVPKTKDGIPLLSVELLMNNKTTAVLWRGDRISEYILNILENVNFEIDVDYLIMDLPPGTSNAVQAPIEFVKKHGLRCGIVFISTPQSVSVNDTEKAINASRKLNIPIIGVIEGMSSFVCPNCKVEHKIFGEGVVKKMCVSEGITYLGNIPLFPELSSVCDQGMTINTIPTEVSKHMQPIISNILKFYGE